MGDARVEMHLRAQARAVRCVTHRAKLQAPTARLLKIDKTIMLKSRWRICWHSNKRCIQTAARF